MGLFGSTVDGLHEDTSDLVRVGVGRGAAILKVTVTLSGGLSGDTNRGTTVRDTI